MCLHISSSLSLSNHPWISQNENCILVNSSLPLIRACWHPLILPFWSPQHKYGFPSKHLTSFVTEYLLVLWGVSLPQGGSIYHYSILTGGSLYHGGQNTISHRPYEVTIPLGWANEWDRAPQFRQRILLFSRCHLTVPHGSGQSRVMHPL